MSKEQAYIIKEDGTMECTKHHEKMVWVRGLINQDGETEATEYACRSCIREANEKDEPIRVYPGPIRRMSKREQQEDALDLLINTLREHEKELDREVEGLRKLRKISDPAIQSVVAAMVHAIHVELKDMDRTTTRLFVTEFFHSLNRKGVVSNDDTGPLIQKAYELLDVK